MDKQQMVVGEGAAPTMYSYYLNVLFQDRNQYRDNKLNISGYEILVKSQSPRSKWSLPFYLMYKQEHVRETKLQTTNIQSEAMS